MRKLIFATCVIGMFIGVVLLMRIVPDSPAITVREATPVEKRLAELEEALGGYEAALVKHEDAFHFYWKRDKN